MVVHLSIYRILISYFKYCINNFEIFIYVNNNVKPADWYKVHSNKILKSLDFMQNIILQSDFIHCHMLQCIVTKIKTKLLLDIL